MSSQEFSKADIKVLQCPNDLVVRKLRGCARLPDHVKVVARLMRRVWINGEHERAAALQASPSQQ
jgi:hypothetical protein